MLNIMAAMFSPRLIRVYGDTRMGPYQPGALERMGDKVISTVSTIWKITYYTSPFICVYLYNRGFFTVSESISLMRFFSGVAVLMGVSVVLRAVGRSRNPVYTKFLSVLHASTDSKAAYLDNLRKYEFEYNSWPVSYTVERSSTSWELTHPFQRCANSDLPVYKRVPCQVLAYLAVHSFGLRLIYPGSLSIIHYLLGSGLLEGRAALIEEEHGKRAKIATAEGNHIDTMFVDCRAAGSDILVICCEGNSGFYEVGIMASPIKCRVSTLGWNHPGFATSTGQPYPRQEQNAIDAVVQYAIHELGFPVDRLVMFGWSIGGYTAAWAASRYPECKGLILDATFDDLLPLAQRSMPPSWSLLVREVVRSYVDLDVASLLAEYRGPVMLVRRTDDEIICLTPGQLSTNRANNLLLKVLEQRHPDAFCEHAPALYKYVGLKASARDAMLAGGGGADVHTSAPLRLIHQYLRDHNSTHCAPLGESDFLEVLQALEAQKKKII